MTEKPVTLPKKIVLQLRLLGLGGTARWVKNSIIMQFLKLTPGHLMNVRIHGYRMQLDPKDPGISRQLILEGTRERQLKYIMDLELREGSTVIDLGANCGYYALMEWALVGPKGKVYAVEPSPQNYERLVENVKLNHAQDVIETFQMAGGEEVGKGKLFLSEHSNLNTFMPYHLGSERRTKGATDDSVTVDVIDMSTFIKGKRSIDLLRMDIEGYEVEVLAGLREAIEGRVFTGRILFECHIAKYGDENHSMREQLSMLFDNGYEPTLMTSSREENCHFHAKGYRPAVTLPTVLSRRRGIYYGVSKEDAKHLICDAGSVRDVLLTKPQGSSTPRHRVETHPEEVPQPTHDAQELQRVFQDQMSPLNSGRKERQMSEVNKYARPEEGQGKTKKKEVCLKNRGPESHHVAEHHDAVEDEEGFLGDPQIPREQLVVKQEQIIEQQHGGNASGEQQEARHRYLALSPSPQCGIREEAYRGGGAPAEDSQVGDHSDKRREIQNVCGITGQIRQARTGQIARDNDNGEDQHRGGEELQTCRAQVPHLRLYF